MARVVKDLEEAQKIIKDTVDGPSGTGTEWGDDIKHPEPKIIIACAMVTQAAVEERDSLESRVAALEEELNGR